MKHIFCFLLLLSLAIPFSAYGACTKDELEAKHKTLDAQIQALSQKEPQRSERLKEEFVEKMNAIHEKGRTQGLTEQQVLDAVCKVYDSMLKKSKK